MSNEQLVDRPKVALLPEEQAARVRAQYGASESIASQMPLVHRGGQRWTSIVAKCSCCSKEIADDRLHGTVTPMVDRTVFVIDAVAYCDECKLFSPCYWRLHDTMAATGVLNNRWFRFEMQATWRARLQERIAQAARAVRWLFTFR